MSRRLWRRPDQPRTLRVTVDDGDGRPVETTGTVNRVARDRIFVDLRGGVCGFVIFDTRTGDVADEFFTRGHRYARASDPDELRRLIAETEPGARRRQASP